MSLTGKILRLIAVILVIFFLMTLFDVFPFRFCATSYNGICYPN